MNVLILNLILTTSENGIIKRRASIKDTMIYNFALGFIKNGCNVTLIASEEFKPTQDEVYDFDIKFLKSSLPKIFRPDLIPLPKGLREYLKYNIKNFDIVITSEIFSMVTLLASDICKEKLVIWQEMAYHQRKFFELPSKFWHNIVVRSFLHKCLVVPRSYPAMDFINKYTKNVSSEHIDHGVNGDILIPKDSSNESFVIISQLIPRKNIGSMIDIFSDFISKTEFKNYKLNIIGDGEEYNSLLSKIEKLGMKENIVLHGFMPHVRMREYLRSAKAMLVNTRRDLNMVSITESIVVGTPIVTNTLPTTAKYIEKNHLGVVKDNWDYTDLLNVIKNNDYYRESCLKVRDELTNVGATRKMISIWKKWCNSYNINK